MVTGTPSIHRHLQQQMKKQQMKQDSSSNRSKSFVLPGDHVPVSNTENFDIYGRLAPNQAASGKNGGEAIEVNFVEQLQGNHAIINLINRVRRRGGLPLLTPFSNKKVPSDNTVYTMDGEKLQRYNIEITNDNAQVKLGMFEQRKLPSMESCKRERQQPEPGYTLESRISKLDGFETLEEYLLVQDSEAGKPVFVRSQSENNGDEKQLIKGEKEFETANPFDVTPRYFMGCDALPAMTFAGEEEKEDIPEHDYPKKKPLKPSTFGSWFDFMVGSGSEGNAEPVDTEVNSFMKRRPSHMTEKERQKLAKQQWHKQYLQASVQKVIDKNDIVLNVTKNDLNDDDDDDVSTDFFGSLRRLQKMDKRRHEEALLEMSPPPPVPVVDNSIEEQAVESENIDYNDERVANIPDMPDIIIATTHEDTTSDNFNLDSNEHLLAVSDQEEEIVISENDEQQQCTRHYIGQFRITLGDDASSGIVEEKSASSEELYVDDIVVRENENPDLKPEEDDDDDILLNTEDRFVTNDREQVYSKSLKEFDEASRGRLRHFAEHSANMTCGQLSQCSDRNLPLFTVQFDNYVKDDLTHASTFATLVTQKEAPWGGCGCRPFDDESIDSADFTLEEPGLLGCDPTGAVRRGVDRIIDVLDFHDGNLDMELDDQTATTFG